MDMDNNYVNGGQPAAIHSTRSTLSESEGASESEHTDCEGYEKFLRPTKNVEKVQVMFDYDAKNTDELPLQRGSVIEVLCKDEDITGGKEWWAGKVMGSNDVGVFPSSFVKPDLKATLVSIDRRASRLELTNIPYKDLIYSEKGFIGQGGFGKVFKGTWQNKTVAIKLAKVKVDDDPKQMIQHVKQEARLFRILNHKYIVSLVGVSLQVPNLCLVLEYCAGGPLNRLLSGRSIHAEILVNWAIQIVKGMEYLHVDAPIPLVHRDLKSCNVLVKEALCCHEVHEMPRSPRCSEERLENLTLKITDFGLAREIMANEHNQFTTVGGTYAWMAPEVIHHGKFSKESDVWSYGVLLWELLTGEIPYRGLDQYTIAYQVVAKSLSLPIPETCPEPLAEIMRACWEREPSNRPSFAHLANLLNDYQNDRPWSQIDESEFQSMQENWRGEIADMFHDLQTKTHEIQQRETYVTQKEKEIEDREDLLLRKGEQLKLKEQQLQMKELQMLTHNPPAPPARTRPGKFHNWRIMKPWAKQKNRHQTPPSISNPSNFRHLLNIDPRNASRTSSESPPQSPHKLHVIAFAENDWPCETVKTPNDSLSLNINGLCKTPSCCDVSKIHTGDEHLTSEGQSAGHISNWSPGHQSITEYNADLKMNMCKIDTFVRHFGSTPELTDNKVNNRLSPSHFNMLRKYDKTQQMEMSAENMNPVVMRSKNKCKDLLRAKVSVFEKGDSIVHFAPKKNSVHNEFYMSDEDIDILDIDDEFRRRSRSQDWDPSDYSFELLPSSVPGTPRRHPSRVSKGKGTKIGSSNRTLSLGAPPCEVTSRARLPSTGVTPTSGASVYSGPSASGPIKTNSVFKHMAAMIAAVPMGGQDIRAACVCSTSSSVPSPMTRSEPANSHQPKTQTTWFTSPTVATGFNPKAPNSPFLITNTHHRRKSHDTVKGCEIGKDSSLQRVKLNKPNKIPQASSSNHSITSKAKHKHPQHGAQTKCFVKSNPASLTPSVDRRKTSTSTSASGTEMRRTMIGQSLSSQSQQSISTMLPSPTVAPPGRLPTLRFDDFQRSQHVAANNRGGVIANHNYEQYTLPMSPGKPQRPHTLDLKTAGSSGGQRSTPAESGISTAGSSLVSFPPTIEDELGEKKCNIPPIPPRSNPRKDILLPPGTCDLVTYSQQGSVPPLPPHVRQPSLSPVQDSPFY